MLNSIWIKNQMHELLTNNLFQKKKWYLSARFLIVFIVAGYFKGYGQLQQGRIIYEKKSIFSLNQEVHFKKDMAARISSDSKGLALSLEIINAKEKRIYTINYKNGVPFSYSVDSFNIFENNREIELESELDQLRLSGKIGIDSTDSKIIHGFKCYKFMTLLGKVYITSAIVSHADISDFFKKTNGGFVMESNIDKSFSNEPKIVSIDDKVNLSLFDIKFETLEKVPSPLQEAIANENNKSESNITVSEISIMEEEEHSSYEESQYTTDKYHFDGTGLSINVPSKYIEDYVFEYLEYPRQWIFDANEIGIVSKNENLAMDTIGMRTRYKYIISYLKPHLARYAPNIRDSENKTDEFVLRNYKPFKVKDFPGIVFTGKYKNINCSYFMFETIQKYLIAKLEYTDKAIIDIDKWISGFEYNEVKVQKQKK